MAYVTENDLHGRTNNPWNLDYTPGGSSGGESAAIAAGMSAGGLGSDSGGSVRVPAHFTGICSLKPTPGRIPGEGHLPPCIGPFSFLGAIGPMARTIDDVTLLFNALSGQDPIDPASPPIALRTPDPRRGQATSHRIFRRRRPDSGDTRDAQSSPGCSASSTQTGIRRSAISSQRPGAGAQAVGNVLRALWCDV